MKQQHRRRLAAFVTASALIGASVIAGALTSPGQIVALPGPEESTVVNVDPTRVLDTRFDVGLTGKFQSHVPRKLMVTGMIETFVEVTNTKTTKQVVPAGATGVIMNVTAVLPTAGGFLSVRPGTANGLPSTAGLNFEAGDVIPNHVSVALPTSGPNAGQIDLTYVAAVVGPTMDVVIDIVGYTTSSGLADLVTLVGTKANSADVYAKTETYSQAEVDAAIQAATPTAQSTATTNAPGGAAPGTIGLSVTVEAPVAGTILINASASILNAKAGRYECRLTKGAGVVSNAGADDLDDTDRRVEPGAGGLDTHCATNGATTVAAGTHVINFVLETPTATDEYDDATLDAMFVPGGVFATS